MASVGSLGARPWDTQQWQLLPNEASPHYRRHNGRGIWQVSMASLMNEARENAAGILVFKKPTPTRISTKYLTLSCKSHSRVIWTRISYIELIWGNHTICDMKSDKKGRKTILKHLCPTTPSKCDAFSSYSRSTDTYLTLVSSQIISWAHLQAVLLGALGARPESSLSNKTQRGSNVQHRLLINMGRQQMERSHRHIG